MTLAPIAGRLGVPTLSVLVFLAAWETAVRLLHIPPYLLPAPSLIAATLADNFGSLMTSWWFTVRITFAALALAIAGGVLLAALFALSRTAERALAPFAVVLQVTPIVAIAPLIMILTDSPLATVLACAWIVAFFPILANTLTGLRSADASLRDLFALYRASRWQTLRHLLVPAALPRLDADVERQLAAGLFNQVWVLLDKLDRSAGDDDQMVHTAHASRYHWGAAGGPVQWARGEWQCSRVYAVLGRAEPALHHARRCLELATEHDLGPFDVGAAHEALARCYRIIGDTGKTAEHVALARAQSASIADPDDRAILDSDLAGLA